MRRILLLAVAAVVLTALQPASGLAATIPVDDEADDYGTGSGCSLREALRAARQEAPFGGCPKGAGADTINLPAGRYVLTLGPAGDDAGNHGDFDVAGDTTIQGAGADSTTIDGGGIDRVLDVQVGARLELRGVTITGGHASDGADGAAGAPGKHGELVAPSGEPSQGEHGRPGAAGGGIRSAATLIVEDAVISGNRAGDGGDGGAGGAGGIGFSGGSVVGSGGNSQGGSGGDGGGGGGIRSSGPLQIAHSRVVSNRSGLGGSGGGGAAAGRGSTPSCLTCNGGAGGDSWGGHGGSGGLGSAISFGATADIADSLVAQNEGGGAGAGGAGGTGGRGGNHAGPLSPATFGRNGGDGGDSEGGGSDPSRGGAIYADGVATLRNTSVIDNRAGSGGDGGNGGSAGDGGTGNGTEGGVRGAGGRSNGGDGGWTDATGGAYLYTTSGTPTHSVTGSTIARNTAGRGGDGGDGGTAGRGNEMGLLGGGATAGGAGGSADQASGGLFLGDATIVVNTTIAENVGGRGGNGGHGGTTASFFELNEGGDAGNAGDAGGSLSRGDFRHVTISRNKLGAPGVGGEPGTGGDRSGGVNGDPGRAGGLAGNNYTPFDVSLANTVVAGNEAPNCALAPVIDEGHNLSFPDASCPGLNADPKLGPLRDNGGLTETTSLAAGSPAIDLVPPTGARCQPTDQRGVARPQGAACDSGAYEVQAPAAVTGEALAVGPSGARLTGVATPNSGDGSHRFEFGPTPAYGSSTDTRPVGPGPAQASEAIGGLSPGTTYHYRLVVTTDGGTVAGDDRSFTTTQAPPSLPPGQTLPVDRQIPAFTSNPLVRPSSFEADSRRGPSLVTRAAVGARIRFGLSEAAQVTFRVLKPAPGRLRRSRCEKPSRRNRNGRRCTRYVALRGSFAYQAEAGTNQPRFSGRLRNRALKPGRYRLAATATDAAGNKSAPANANFKIKSTRR